MAMAPYLPGGFAVTNRMHGIAALCALVLSSGAGAGAHTVAECFEGSDFIANAALARDNGIDYNGYIHPGQRLRIANRHIVPERLSEVLEIGCADGATESVCRYQWGSRGWCFAISSSQRAPRRISAGTEANGQSSRWRAFGSAWLAS